MRPEAEARRISVRGVVQGVGFRPFVWRLAERHGLTGWVRNADGVVEIHLEGPPASLDAFVEEIGGSPPPLAVVEDVSWTPEDVQGFPGFDVDVSVGRRGRRSARPARRRHLRRVPARALRPGRSPVPVPVHQLHRLRSAIHDHRVPAVRPGANVDAGLPDVRGLPAGVRGSRRPALPRRAHRMSGLRSSDRAPRRVGRPCRRRRRGARRLDAPRRGDRGDQGARRVPPGVRRDRCGGRATAP